MAEYIKFRVSAAKMGVTMAFLALLGGITEKARASSPTTAQASAAIPGVSSLVKLDKVFVKLENSLQKLEQKLAGGYLTAHKVDTTFLKIKTADAQYLKIDEASQKYLKIDDANLNYLKVDAANAQFLKIDGTAANAQKLGGLASSSFVQGNNTSVVSGALNSLNGNSQQLLSLPGGIIVVSVAKTPGSGSQITIHNGTSTALAGAVDMGDGSVSRAVALKPNGDTQLPAVQSNAAEIRLQIFPDGTPGATFTSVVSILIGLTPNPSNSDTTQAVAQAFTGGV